MPLEKNCVRYIDNFSMGNRGAISTEWEPYSVANCITDTSSSKVMLLFSYTEKNLSSHFRDTTPIYLNR